MKQIVASADERYTDLEFDKNHQIALSTETPVICKLELDGCESPLTFNCNITDVKNADLKIFLSTQHKEPTEKNCMRKVDRLKLFKFYADKKRPNFTDDDVLYLTLFSVLGCTITIRASKPVKVEENSDDDMVGVPPQF